MREYTSVFTKLPAVKFDTVEGNGDSVVVRQLNKNGKFYFVKNIPYWKYDYTPSKRYPVTDSDGK